MPRSTRGVLAAAIGLLALAPAAGAEDLPVAAKDSGGGGGAGSMTYIGTALPKLLTVCERNLVFTVGEGWTSNAFAFDVMGRTFAGPVTLTGGGGSNTSCESYSVGGGRLTLALAGHNPLTGATLDCRDDYGDPTKSRSLSGQYVRIAAEIQVILTGRCAVDGHAVGWVSFIVEGAVVPAGAAGGEGVTSSVRTLTTTSLFTVVAA